MPSAAKKFDSIWSQVDRLLPTHLDLSQRLNDLRLLRVDSGDR